MTEEAREAELPERDATPDEAFELGEVAGYDDGYRAGISSGIRQAREAVATVPVAQSRQAALAAIDGLSEPRD